MADCSRSRCTSGTSRRGPARAALVAVTLLAGCRGPAGPPGPPGQAGQAGVLKVERLKRNQVVPAHSVMPVQVDCPAGQRVLAGGFEGQRPELQLSTSWPADEDTWEFQVHNSFGMDQDITLWAVCAGGGG